LNIPRHWRSRLHDGVTHLEASHASEVTNESSNWISIGTFLHHDLAEHIVACLSIRDNASAMEFEKDSGGSRKYLEANNGVEEDRDRYHHLLQMILQGDVGRQVAWKLSEGQATETDDGRAWLAAFEELSISIHPSQA